MLRDTNSHMELLSEIEVFDKAPPPKPAAKPRRLTPLQLLKHEPARFFAKVADLIEKRGWNQGYLENSCDEVCLVGAIGIALGYEVDHETDRFKGGKCLPKGIWRATKLLGFKGPALAMFWNDDEATKDDVLNLLRNWKPPK